MAFSFACAGRTFSRGRQVCSISSRTSPMQTQVPDARPAIEARDPRPAWNVAFGELAAAQLEWLRERGVDLRPTLVAASTVGTSAARIPPHSSARRGDGACAEGVARGLHVGRPNGDRGAAAVGLSSEATGDGRGLGVHRAFVSAFSQA